MRRHSSDTTASRRILSLATLLALASLGAVAGPAAAAQALGQGRASEIAGTAQLQGGQPAPNVPVRARNLDSNQVAGSATTAADGTFTIGGLSAGTYIVEMLDADGMVIGTSMPIMVGENQRVPGIVLVGTAIAPAVASSGASIFTTTGLLLLAGAAAALVAGVTTVGTTASPSR